LSGPREFVVVALGSNLGDSQSKVLRAMERLEIVCAESLRKSSLWRSEPVDCPPGSPEFINAVVGFIAHDGETPESMLDKLQSIEKEFGRRPKQVHNEARPLDLDLIAFGNQTRNTDRLVLPHPRAHQRAFVLLPLSEIASELVLPKQNRTVSELVRQLPDNGGVYKIR
jgi:2-amino-4-hydroxy-6-hydroxymethyldihydropteridine diphosphokinase